MNKTTKELIEDFIKMNVINGNIKREDLDTFIFCFLLIMYLEKTVQNTLYETLLNSQKEELKFPELISHLLKEETFTQKLNTFKFIIKETPLWEKDKDFIDICRTVNEQIRNKLFHFNVNEIHYKNLNISQVEVQNKIIEDLILAEQKVKPNNYGENDEARRKI